ncbi:hypothetical protein NE237_001979 [Protea cynaroides]|uniref:Uncharacterized protein n=1 Tax=Protea cynaroides TaxID=273540 RepID=A0A9Q0QYM3_9MAGN|nr:hypothetical protein NE237_001979 [Protea cynaroides]
MARFAATITLIFSLFLLSNARLQPNEWNPSNSNDLPDSTSNSIHLIDSDTEPKILLPSQKSIEDSVISHEFLEFGSIDATDDELSGSEDVILAPLTINSIEDDDEYLEVEQHKMHKNHGGPFHFPFLFGFHKYCHHHSMEEEEKHKKHGFLFHFFHKHCHHHKKDKKYKEMEKQFQPLIAGEDFPYSGDIMIKSRTAGVFHEKRLHHHHHNNQKKKHSGLLKLFRKFFKHFH